VTSHVFFELNNVIFQLFQISPETLLKDHPHDLLPADVVLDLFPPLSQAQVFYKVRLEEAINRFQDSLAPILVILAALAFLELRGSCKTHRITPPPFFDQMLAM